MMSELKTVTEVCKITGLDRKLLCEYEDTVKPANRKNGGYVSRGKECKGYKLYDEYGVVRLQQIAIFRKVGLNRKEIKKKMNNVNYNVNEVLNEQILLLNEKKREIEGLILLTESMRMTGVKNDLVNIYIHIDKKSFL